ncbi:unnamed protein product [Gongylonema pulchrum]|uniref:Uncharacterized protein n=1 Tax=Gongylonema pulchrum TaxID=637853 RepID=A0A183DV25_9BILA|nr:unnamed protein product [Gongylonema pulchrum]
MLLMKMVMMIDTYSVGQGLSIIQKNCTTLTFEEGTPAVAAAAASAFAASNMRMIVEEGELGWMHGIEENCDDDDGRRSLPEGSLLQIWNGSGGSSSPATNIQIFEKLPERDR